MPNYWIGVASHEHVRNAVEGGFCQLNHGKEAPLRQLARGDVIVFYSPREAMRGGEPLQSFTAVGEIVDDSPFKVEQTESFHPFRRRVKYHTTKATPIHAILSQLSFTSKSSHWGASLRRGFFKINEEDFAVIAKAMDVPAATIHQR